MSLTRTERIHSLLQMYSKWNLARKKNQNNNETNENLINFKGVFCVNLSTKSNQTSFF